MSKVNRETISLDKIGMCTSVICLVHCISIPLFFLFGFDAALRIIDQPWVEWMIIVFALFVGVVSFLGGFLTHRQHFIPVLFLAGFMLLINGESVVNEVLSLILSVGGGLVIIYAHVQNLKWRLHASRV